MVYSQFVSAGLLTVGVTSFALAAPISSFVGSPASAVGTVTSGPLNIPSLAPVEVAATSLVSEIIPSSAVVTANGAPGVYTLSTSSAEAEIVIASAQSPGGSKKESETMDRDPAFEEECNKDYKEVYKKLVEEGGKVLPNSNVLNLPPAAPALPGAGMTKAVGSIVLELPPTASSAAVEIPLPAGLPVEAVLNLSKALDANPVSGIGAHGVDPALIPGTGMVTPDSIVDLPLADSLHTVVATPLADELPLSAVDPVSSGMAGFGAHGSGPFVVGPPKKLDNLLPTVTVAVDEGNEGDCEDYDDLD